MKRKWETIWKFGGPKPKSSPKEMQGISFGLNKSFRCFYRIVKGLIHIRSYVGR